MIRRAYSLLELMGQIRFCVAVVDSYYLWTSLSTVMFYKAVLRNRENGTVASGRNAGFPSLSTAFLSAVN